MQVEAHKLARTFRCNLFHSDTSLRKFSRNRVGKTRPGNSLAPKLQLDRTEFKRHFQVWKRDLRCSDTKRRMPFVMLKIGHSRALFHYFRPVSSVNRKQKLLLNGFELRLSAVGSDRSTNCATTAYLILSRQWKNIFNSINVV